MKIYLAAVYTAGFHLQSVHATRCTEQEMAHRRQVRYHLESYHYVHAQGQVERMRRDGIKIFLDSGAFSAFTQGVKVDLPKYCDYCKRNEDIIDFPSVLDGIGDPQLTYDNQLWMEHLGVKPLPCFHYGEDTRYLEHYIKNYDYITLGGMVPISTKDLFIWLDYIWDEFLTDGAGHPRLKVHGFGLTSIPLMDRYPWYSVDSSSWVQFARTGNIMVPDLGCIAISSDSPARKQHLRHATTRAPIEQERIRHEIEKRGFEWDRLATDYASRFCFNLATFRELNDIMNERACAYSETQMRLF